MSGSTKERRPREWRDGASGEYLTTRGVHELTGLAMVTLDLWRRQGRGPAFIKIGRRVMYRRADIETWLDQHRLGA
jgi:predicted DNA-binding transcriptional regulator AlpA